MKFTTVAAFFLPAVMAASPDAASNGHIAKRQTAATDELLFSISLPAFIARRDALDPPGLDWSSNSCTSSPDNPFGFPFDRESRTRIATHHLILTTLTLAACKRHDFGYRNYKAQSRFSDANKLRIDDNFLDEYVPLEQCEAFQSARPELY